MMTFPAAPGMREAGSSLAGMKVLEIAESLSARFCGLLLAELGAQVWTYMDSASHAEWLGSPSAALLHRWLAGYKHQIPGENIQTAPAMGADADLLVTDQLCDRLPWLNTLVQERSLPVIAITPFGLSGPRVPGRAIDVLASHASGYAYYLAGAWPGRPPARGPEGQAELLAGLAGALAALSGAPGQDTVANRRLADISVQEVNSSLLFEEVSEYDSGVLPATRRQDAMMPVGLILMLPAADGAVVASPREQHQWDRMVSALGIGDRMDDSELSTPAMRVTNWREAQRRLAEFTRHRAKAELCGLLQGARVACFPVNSVPEAIREPAPRNRGFWSAIPTSNGQTATMPGLPFTFAEAAAGSGAPAPRDLHPLRDRPLRGIRVIDFSWVIAGPVCTRLLALLGAEVIKIESRSRPEHRSRKADTDLLNISKKSVTIDLKNPAGNSLVRDLIRHSDCVVENFGPGVMARLGLSWQELAGIRPDLVMLSMSGLGRKGAGGTRVAYGSLLQAYSGWMAQTGQAQAGSPVVGERPMGVRPVWADQIAGMLGSLAILASLRRRERTGQGRYIDLSMFESLLLMESAGIARAQSSAPGGPGRTSDSPAAMAAHGCYRCKGDDQWVAIAVCDDEQRQRLMALLGHPERAQGLENARSRRAASRDIGRQLESWTSRRCPEEVLGALRSIGVPAARSHSLKTLLADPLIQDRRMFSLLPDGRHCISLPWFDPAADRGAVAPAPVVGENNAEVLRQILGFDDDVISSLENDGAFGQFAGA